MATKSLMQMLLDAGYPKEDIHNHESDLYIYVTPLTTNVLENWCKANGWHKELVKSGSYLLDTFIDQITGRKMYDIAFQYLPWWEEREMKNNENMARR